MISVIRPFGEVVVSPFEIHHTNSELCKLTKLLSGLPGATQSADHVEEQPDLSTRHGFFGHKPPIFKSSAYRWQGEMGGLRSDILAL